MPSLAASWTRMPFLKTSWMRSTTCLSMKVHLLTFPRSYKLRVNMNILWHITMQIVGSDDDVEDRDEPTDFSSMDSVDPFDFVYSNLPDSTYILKQVPNCKHCNARRFEHESDGFCCRNGQIKLHEPESIPELKKLWSSTDAESRHFRESIRFLNGHFSFTTLGVNLDTSCTNMRSGVYTFRASGSLYHNVHSFGPGSRRNICSYPRLQMFKIAFM